MQPTERLHTLELSLHAGDMERIQCFTLASPRHPALVVLDALRQAGHCHTPEWDGDPRPR